MYNYTSSQTTLNGLTIKKNIATDKLNCEALNTNWKQVENIQWMPQKNQLFLDKSMLLQNNITTEYAPS